MNDEKAYQFGMSRLIIKFGDLTSAVTDVIVSSDDAYLSMGGGVSASILRPVYRYRMEHIFCFQLPC